MVTTNAPTSTTGAAYKGQTDGTSQSGETSSISSGMLGQKGKVPSATTREQDSLTRNALQIQALFSAIKEIMPEGQEDTEVLLLQIAESLKETQGKLQAMGIEASTANKKADLKELSNKQAEAEAARKKAAKKSGIAKLFSKIAGFFSAVATIALGVGMAIGGNPAGIAVAVIGGVMLASEISKEISGKSLFAHMYNNPYFEMGMMIGLGIAAAIVSGGTSAAATATTAASAATSTAVTVSTTAATVASTAAQVGARSIAQWAKLGIGLLQSSISITGAGVSLSASLGQASAQKLNANLKDFEAVMEALSEFLERAIKQYIGIEKSIENLTDQAYEAVKNKQSLTMSIKVSV